MRFDTEYIHSLPETLSGLRAFNPSTLEAGAGSSLLSKFQDSVFFWVPQTDRAAQSMAGASHTAGTGSEEHKPEPGVPLKEGLNKAIHYFQKELDYQADNQCIPKPKPSRIKKGRTSHNSDTSLPVLYSLR